MKNKIEKVLTDIDEITKNYKNQKVTLVAVSKKKPVTEILKAVKLGIKQWLNLVSKECSFMHLN